MRLRGLSIVAVAIACSSQKAERAPVGQGSPSKDAAPIADDRYRSESLGALEFALSEGAPLAREHFARGLLALHSFWYDEAQRQFQAAIEADRSMDMAYWGLAMSQIKLLWGDDDVAAAKAALKGMPDPDKLSEREQAWIIAAIELLEAEDVPTSRKQFVASMETLHEKFPDDESATFLAIALLSKTRPEDLDHLAIRNRAGELAGAVFAQNRKHPGAAHYAIHAYDTPRLAANALPFAEQYAKIAPEAFHARHMPAHIFVRLGMWKEAIESCRAAWDASIAAAKRHKLSANHHDFHSLNWLVEMPFEIGRRSDAEASLKVFADAVRAGLGAQHRAVYATQVGSFLTRTGEWSRVDELLAPLDAAPREEPTGTRSGNPQSCHAGPSASPHADFERLAVLETRARAAAMQHDLATTKRYLAQADAVRTKLRPFLEKQGPQAVARIDAETVRRRRSLTARATKNDQALLDVLRDSINDASVDATGETNPSGFFVAEEIGDTLLRMKKHADAATAYARALEIQPNRARSLLGAARAAIQLGDTARAKELYKKLTVLWESADADMRELAEARDSSK